MKRRKPVSSASSLGTETNAQIVNSNFADWRLRLQTTYLAQETTALGILLGSSSSPRKLLLLWVRSVPFARSDKHRDSTMWAGLPSLFTLQAAEELLFLMNRDYGVPWEVIMKIRGAWWVGPTTPYVAPETGEFFLIPR